MRPNRLFLLLFTYLPFFVFAQRSPEPIPGDILLMLTPNGRAGDIARDLKEVDGVTTGLYAAQEVSAPMRIWLMKFTPGTVRQERMLDAVKEHPMVMMAQNDVPVTYRALPNDPGIAQQWHHAKIQTPQAWDVTTGGRTATGDSIVVCVVEGANMLHADLVGNRWLNHAEIPGNGIDDDGNGYVDDHRGWNPAGGNDNAYSGSHGTQVAGMIGAKGNNGSGGVGANWNVKIMPVTVGSLTQANVIASYTYPLVMRRRYNQSGGTQGAFVVATNSSWGIDNGNPASYPLWCAMYDTLGAAGILNCGSTSNSAVNVDVVGDMPTACSSPFMVSVTATNSSDVRTFSGYGATTIDVGAPGENVYTTSGTTSGSTGFGSTSGTSFAGPLTAGVIALLYSAPCPELMGLVASDPEGAALYVREKLFSGVDVGGNLVGQTVTGGRINANNSMQLVMADCGSYCAGVSGLTITSTSPTAILAQWSGAGDQSFDLRYRAVGTTTWTTLSSLTGSQAPVSALGGCATFEFQVRRQCADEATSNWSNSVTWLHASCCTAVTIPVVADRYGNEITWSIVSGGTTYASGGPYTQYASNGQYPQTTGTACLPDGCYELRINDSYGDGICCAFGNGSIQVLGAGGAVLAVSPTTAFSQVSVPFCISSGVQVSARVFLAGAYTGTQMSDALRAGGLIPTQEPYTAAGWAQVDGGGETIGSGVLNVTGANAITDWVRLELRQASTPATIVATRQALVQRDGDIVSAADGVSPVSFDAPPGQYHIAVRHRNHLGCMTAAPVQLSGTSTTLDLTLTGTAIYGTNGRNNVNGAMVLWPGDVNRSGSVLYTGEGNDRDLVLQAIGGTVPTNSLNNVYDPRDVNLDGSVIYTGSGNDRDMILQTIGGTVPTAVRNQQLP
ncbi:MAG TPA: S8 family serine peptidase [Flavobacteriales bacterium]|nr:S8 family serine peptidase [Flavobacteriales bacterium]